MSEDKEAHIHLPDHTQPSDYSDVQPKTYDPDFISQISTKMQVPDRISVAGYERENGYTNPELPAATQFVGMTVPDRIVLAVEERRSCRDSPPEDHYQMYPDMNIPYALYTGYSSTPERNNSMERSWIGSSCNPTPGDNQHLALKQDLNLDVSSSHRTAPESLSYVGLITPPRTLTLEERFPVVEETDDQKMMAAHGSGASRSHLTANGHISGPTPYDPGVSLQDSVLLNEENEATLLRTQVAKLTRRVQVIEQDNQKRATREVVMYPLILGYFLWKILGWFTRDR